MSPMQDFLSSFRRKRSAESIIKELHSLRSLKILVIGDAIIDQYLYTSPMGKESKEPLVVHRHEGEELFAGGTLATANHVSALSNHVTLVTLLGKSPS